MSGNEGEIEYNGGTGELFIILTVGVSSHLPKYAKAYQVVHLTEVPRIIFQSYFRKTIDKQSRFIIFILLKV